MSASDLEPASVLDKLKIDLKRKDSPTPIFDQLLKEFEEEKAKAARPAKKATTTRKRKPANMPRKGVGNNRAQ